MQQVTHSLTAPIHDFANFSRALPSCAAAFVTGAHLFRSPLRAGVWNNATLGVWRLLPPCSSTSSSMAAVLVCRPAECSMAQVMVSWPAAAAGYKEGSS